MERSNDRKLNQLRDITIEPNVNMHAEGSVLVSFGNTKVICTATIDTNVPRWMKGSDEGWVTAEYGMLPRSTNERMSREAARGKQSGRTQEIQRLIGRSLRQAVDLKYIKGKTINIDCVALFLALQNHHDDHRAIKRHIAAVSLGILNDEVILDLDYKEDSNAETDLNLVMTDSLELIEIQGTAEEAPFTKDQLNQMLELGSSAIADIIEKQKACLK
jgi:ribonuclease PH